MSAGSTVYALLHATGIAALARRRDAAPLLCFHNVVPQAQGGNVGDRSLHVGLQDFETYADWLKRTYNIVSMGELAARRASGRPLRGLAAITFDDAYRGVVRHALPALRRAGLPCTIFVIGDAPDSDRCFWWDDAAARGRLGEADRDRFLSVLAGDGARIAAELGGGATTALPDDLRPAAWSELRDALHDGVEIGAHTMTHRNLVRLAPDEARREMDVSRERVAEQLGRTARLVTYPYGGVNRAVASMARELGFDAAATMRYGLVSAASDAYLLPRVNVAAGLAVPTLASFAAGLRLRPPQ